MVIQVSAFTSSRNNNGNNTTSAGGSFTSPNIIGSERNFNPGIWADAYFIPAPDIHSNERNVSVPWSAVLGGATGSVYLDSITDSHSDTLVWIYDFGPYLANRMPVLDEYPVDPNTLIRLDILDFNDNISDDTIRVYVNDALAYNGSTDSILSPYNGIDSYTSDVSSGKHITLDYVGNFDSYEQVTLHVIAQDSSDNDLDETYSFRISDSEGILFTNIIPSESSTGVSESIVINVDLYDKGVGVDLYSIDAYVDDQLAFKGSTQTFYSPYNGSQSNIVYNPVDGYHGYRLTIDKVGTYLSYETIEVRVIGDDKEGNQNELNFTFQIGDYVAPFLRNESPTSTGIAGDVLISVDVFDDASKVDLSLFDAYVNGTKVFMGPNTFISPYNGPSSSITAVNVDGYDGYKLVLDYIGTFTPRTQYVTRIVVYDKDLNQLDDSWTFRTGTEINTIDTGIYEITIDATFGENVTVDSALSNPANYIFNNGMYARYVDVISSSQVRLWVELFYENEEFTLTIGPDIKDQYGNELPETFNSISISPFQSTATMGGFNGKVRTWRESGLVSADSQRIYLAGSKGIDVFRKEASMIPRRWGQIFDAYGIDSMFVAHFGEDILATDSDSPYFQSQIPFPETTVSPGTNIWFIITDNTTTIEIPSLTVYVNNVVAFNGGYGGFYNGFSGNIVIGYKKLEVTIIPPTPFVDGETIYVKVVALDVLENRLNGSYKFYVGVLVLEDGFGGDEWGISSFGGI